MDWKIEQAGCLTAEANMAADYARLEALPSMTKPLLRLYNWEGPSLTYGHFIKPEKILDINAPIAMARRPTGGGIIFHLTDFTFSVLVPSGHPAYSLNTLDNYAFVNTLVIKAIRHLRSDLTPTLLANSPSCSDSPSCHFCMAKATKYDVILDGKKVGGAAQRRTRHGFLHQGTISLAPPPWDFLEEVLLPGTDTLQMMQQESFFLLDNPADLNDAHHSLANALVDVIEK